MSLKAGVARAGKDAFGFVRHADDFRSVAGQLRRLSGQCDETGEDAGREVDGGTVPDFGLWSPARRPRNLRYE